MPLNIPDHAREMLKQEFGIKTDNDLVWLSFIATLVLAKNADPDVFYDVAWRLFKYARLQAHISMVEVYCKDLVKHGQDKTNEYMAQFIQESYTEADEIAKQLRVMVELFANNDQKTDKP
jgi:hypothetical protein